MKYPRTKHIPQSQGGTADDERLVDIQAFKGKKLVLTEKMDGENTIFSSTVIHARSEDGYGRPWQTYLKKFWSSIKKDIPEGINICGENMYAIHSIEYNKLDSFFYVFGIFDETRAYSWKEVEEWCSLLNLKHVPILGYTTIEEVVNMQIPEKSVYGDICEGFVVRNIESFKTEDFCDNVAKCVRANHVQTDIHWTKNWKKAKII